MLVNEPDLIIPDTFLLLALLYIAAFVTSFFNPAKLAIVVGVLIPESALSRDTFMIKFKT